MGEAWPCQLPCPAAKVPGVVSWATSNPSVTRFVALFRFRAALPAVPRSGTQRPRGACSHFGSRNLNNVTSRGSSGHPARRSASGPAQGERLARSLGPGRHRRGAISSVGADGRSPGESAGQPRGPGGLRP